MYYNTRRSIRGGSQYAPPGDKAWCIIAPIEWYSGYRHFQWKKEELQSSMPWFCLFSHAVINYIYLSAIKRLICRREMSLIGSTSFGFTQNMMHDFKNTVLTRSGIVFDKCHKKASGNSGGKLTFFILSRTAFYLFEEKYYNFQKLWSKFPLMEKPRNFVIWWRIKLVCCNTSKIMLMYEITLYSIDTHFDASTTDSFWKHCVKSRNCS